MSKHIVVRALIFAAVALSAFTSCSKDGIKNQKVAVLLPDHNIVNRWAEDKQNLETVMGKYGFNATFYTAPETADGAALQVQQMKTAIEGGAKFIVLTAIDYKTINESGLLAKYPDVKFVCHDRLLLDNPHIAYVSSADTKEIGHIQALYLLNHFHSSGASSMTVEILAGPDTDVNAKDYYDGAMALLKPYIDAGDLVIVSGKKEYAQVKADSWGIADGKKAMKNRLSSYGLGNCPDMILASNDNLAQGAIEALEEAGFTDMPVITGQDNTAMAQNNISSFKQAMTIDKNLNDMAYNTAMIINCLMAGAPVQSSHSISVGSVKIPVFYSKNTLITIDSI